MQSEDKKLGEFCTLIAGTSFPERYQGSKSGDFPFIKVSDMKLKLNQHRIIIANNWVTREQADELRARPVPAGSVVFAKIGIGLLAGRMRLTTMPTLIDNNMMAAIPKNGTTPEALYTIMNTLDMSTWAIGAALPYLRGSDLLKIKLDNVVFENLTVASTAESNLNLLREEIIRTMGTLDQVISQLFRSWFINFEPVKNKSQDKLMPGLDDATMQLFPDSFQSTEIGPIPSGWKVVRLGDIVNLTKGLSYKGEFLEETADEGIRMLNLGCFGIDGSFRRDKIKYYSGDHKEKHLLRGGDILIANTDMTQDRIIIGSCIVVPSKYESALFTHHTSRLRVKDDLDFGLNSFIAKQLAQPTFRHIAEGYSTGSTVLALPKNAILNFKIAMPPDDLLQRFFEVENEFYSKSQTMIASLESLQKIADLLLPRQLERGAQITSSF